MNASLARVLAIGTLVAVASSALAQNDTYCLQSGKWGFPENCQFSTYRECMEAASGTSATCGRNSMSYRLYDRSDYRR